MKLFQLKTSTRFSGSSSFVFTQHVLPFFSVCMGVCVCVSTQNAIHCISHTHTFGTDCIWFPMPFYCSQLQSQSSFKFMTILSTLKLFDAFFLGRFIWFEFEKCWRFFVSVRTLLLYRPLSCVTHIDICARIQISLRSRSLLHILMGLLHVFSWYFLSLWLALSLTLSLSHTHRPNCLRWTLHVCNGWIYFEYQSGYKSNGDYNRTPSTVRQHDVYLTCINTNPIWNQVRMEIQLETKSPLVEVGEKEMETEWMSQLVNYSHSFVRFFFVHSPHIRCAYTHTHTQYTFSSPIFIVLAVLLAFE